MMETIETRCSEPKWHWDNVQADLKRAGLADVTVYPLTVRAHSCGGDHDGNRFYLTWLWQRFALLSMQREDDALVHALTTVLDYAPLCRYREANGVLTVEWERTPDAMRRITELLARGLSPEPVVLAAAP